MSQVAGTYSTPDTRGATPIYTLRWPEYPDPADGPLAFQNLAEDVEAALGVITSTLTLTAGLGLTGGGTLPATLDVGAGPGVLVAADTVSADPAWFDNRYPAKTVQIAAGAGLSGGGDLSATRTLDVGQGVGIVVAADTVSVDQAWLDGRYASDTNTVTAGVGLTGGGAISTNPTLNVAVLDTTITLGADGIKANVGTTAGTVAAGNHTHPAGSAAPLAGDGLTGGVTSYDVGAGTGIVVTANAVAADIGTGPGQVAAGNHIHSGNWPITQVGPGKGGTISGTNNIDVTQAIAVASDPFPRTVIITLSVNVTITGSGSAVPRLRILEGGAMLAEIEIENGGACLAYQHNLGAGLASSLKGNIDVPAGWTVTSYANENKFVVTSIPKQ